MLRLLVKIQYFHQCSPFTETLTATSGNSFGGGATVRCQELVIVNAYQQTLLW